MNNYNKLFFLAPRPTKTNKKLNMVRLSKPHFLFLFSRHFFFLLFYIDLKIILTQKDEY